MPSFVHFPAALSILRRARAIIQFPPVNGVDFGGLRRVNPISSFDCIICTQTLQFVSDPKAALATLHRILAPGGVLLLTVPCLSQLDRDPSNSWQDNWRFTSRGVAELFRQAIGSQAETSIDAPGNVLAATAFLHGLSADELAGSELDYRDPAYELLVTVRHRKPVFSL